MRTPTLSRRPFLALFGAATATLALTPGARAAPEAVLWERWLAHDDSSDQVIDHSAWEGLAIRKVRRVNGVALVDYASFTAADKAAHEAYIAQLSATPVSTLNRREQYAYWLNFYNALTVKVILDHYPVESIRDIDISPGFFSNGPWGAKLVRVEGEEMSLDDIEHRVLRPIWRDPLIHYGVNCAAIGCPDLRIGAYTSANVERALEQAARRYVNNPRGVRIENGRLIVSSIYAWFSEDFGETDANVIAHLRQYAEPGLAAQLARFDRIFDDRYDWSLNDAARPVPVEALERRDTIREEAPRRPRWGS